MKALITGATSGLGMAMAEILSKKGWELVLTGRNLDVLHELQVRLKTNVYIIQADLSKIDEVYRVYEECEGHSIDLLINNAGFGVFGYFAETPLKNDVEQINVNITAVHVLTKLFLQDFLKHNRGRIINIASVAGFMTGPLLSGYYASKSYVIRLSLAIADELRRKKSNVKISVFCPGPIDTNFNKRAGVKFSVKPKSAKSMAEYVISRAFDNEVMIIPSFSLRMGVIASKILPERMVNAIIYRIQKNKYK